MLSILAEKSLLADLSRAPRGWRVKVGLSLLKLYRRGRDSIVFDFETRMEGKGPTFRAYYRTVNKIRSKSVICIDWGD